MAELSNALVLTIEMPAVGLSNATVGAQWWIAVRYTRQGGQWKGLNKERRALH
jgi:hypothetical protein